MLVMLPSAVGGAVGEAGSGEDGDDDRDDESTNCAAHDEPACQDGDGAGGSSLGSEQKPSCRPVVARDAGGEEPSRRSLLVAASRLLLLLLAAVAHENARVCAMAYEGSL